MVSTIRGIPGLLEPITTSTPDALTQASTTESSSNDAADLVIGFRSFGQMPVYRRFGRAVLDRVTCAGGTVTDSQSGFRALNRKAIQLLRLFNIFWNGFKNHREHRGTQRKTISLCSLCPLWFNLLCHNPVSQKKLKSLQLLVGTLKKDDFSIESEMMRRSHDLNLRMAEVQIQCKYGDFDTSAKNPVSHGVGVLG